MIACSPESPSKIVIAGNPNCGKTSLFNALTGSNYKVANYPGVTVEKKEGSIQIKGRRVRILDLPGIYSITGNSIDEKIASKTLLGEMDEREPPDLIISVIDAANLERNLYLTTQLLDLKIPVIVAVNMTDLAEKEGIKIRYELLARSLNLPLIPIVASRKQGLEDLKNEISKALASAQSCNSQYPWQELHEAGKSAEEAAARYSWIHAAVEKSCVIETRTKSEVYERIDAVLTHKFWGMLIFFILMAIIFQSIFTLAAYPMEWIDLAVTHLQSLSAKIIPHGTLRSLISGGIITGVGSVLVFVPQIAILCFFLGLLEDSGYLSRAAFMMDKIMRKFGLQGRSFIPMLSSFACAIPGIMSTRSIPSFRDRLTTIMVAPLMSCSARLPVYTLLIAAFIPETYYFGFISSQGLTLLSMYLLGIAGAVLAAALLRFGVLRGQPSMFVMEMPRFRAPSVRLVLREIYDRIKIFIKNAGSVILACTIILWFLASYPEGEVKNSYAGRIGTFMEPAIKPLGYNWEIGVGILASFAAREIFISSLGTVYNLQESDDQAATLLSALKSKKASHEFSTATAVSLMVFFVFACQCMSTLAVCKRETGSWRWPALMFAYMTGLAYVTAYIAYNLTSMFFISG